MKIENRHHIVAYIISVIFTAVLVLITSIIGGVSWKIVISSGIAGTVYFGLFVLAFGSPIYTMTRIILAKRSEIVYPGCRKKSNWMKRFKVTK
jgi:hypothetical protein